MSRLLVIGCGGVASVAIRKCCQNSDVFTEIMIASRTKEKCDALKEKIESTTKTKIETAKVDADNAAEVAELIRAYKPDAVLNVALPYQDLTITDRLSTWADFVSTETSSVTVTNSDGQPLSTEDYTVAINGKNITVRFPNKLEAGETYTISFPIKPTQEAYDQYATELQYPNTGDVNTDAEGNNTSSKQLGFYSNETATLKYHIVTSTNGQDEVGAEKTAAYRKPVLQVELSQIQVEKKWEGAAPEDVAEEMAELVAELDDISHEKALTAAAYFHAKFENIHPFADGNGRTGRLAMNYFLVIHSHPPIIIHEEDRKTYYTALEAWDTHQELTPLCSFLKEQTAKTWEKQIQREEKRKRNQER